jgi:parallel beta-helix repeat protein
MGMAKKIISLLLIALILAVSIPAASATEGTTHYVLEGESIQDAIDSAAPGDTIAIGPGEYVIDDLIMTKSLTLRGSGAEATILYGSIHLLQPPAADGLQQEPQYRIITDMTIDNIKTHDGYFFDPAITTSNLSDTPEAGPDGGSYFLSEVKVTDCVIRSETGIYILGAETVEIASTQLYGFWMYHVVISADELDGNGYPEDNGIYASNCDAVSVSSSSIMGYYANGIEVTSCSNVRIVNNIITGCDMAGVNLDAASVILTNNTLVENRVAIDIDAETAAVANNIAVISSRPSAFDSLTSDIDISTDDELYFVNNDIYKFRLFVCTP